MIAWVGGNRREVVLLEMKWENRVCRMYWLDIEYEGRIKDVFLCFLENGLDNSLEWGVVYKKLLRIMCDVY